MDFLIDLVFLYVWNNFLFQSSEPPNNRYIRYFIIIRASDISIRNPLKIKFPIKTLCKQDQSRTINCSSFLPHLLCMKPILIIEKQIPIYFHTYGSMQNCKITPTIRYIHKLRNIRNSRAMHSLHRIVCPSTVETTAKKNLFRLSSTLARLSTRAQKKIPFAFHRLNTKSHAPRQRFHWTFSLNL